MPVVYLAYDSPVAEIAFDSVAVESDSNVQYVAPSAAVKIRTEFPETWIWEMVDDNGCESYHL